MSLAAFFACDSGVDTVPPPAGYVPTAGDDDDGTGDDDDGGSIGSDGGKIHPPRTDSGGQGDDDDDDDGGDPPVIGNDGGAITGNGCAGGTCQNPTCQALGTPADPGAYPQLGFEAQPSYIPNDVIIPTFDDVPDGENSPPDPTYGAGSWTKKTLAFLATNGIHADFFINTNNWCGDVSQDAECTADIIEILSLHNPANHTVYHPHLGTASTTSPPALPDGCADPASCEEEVTGVELVVKSMSNGGRPHLTRFRAPYGEPYQAQGAGLTMVEGVVSKYAVAVGWNMDTKDSDGVTTGAQIAQTVQGLVGTGPGKGTNWGILLQHATYPWTYDAMPLLYGPKGYLATHGFKLGTIEDAICWKFGKHSWELVQKASGQPRSPN